MSSEKIVSAHVWSSCLAEWLSRIYRPAFSRQQTNPCSSDVRPPKPGTGWRYSPTETKFISYTYFLIPNTQNPRILTPPFASKRKFMKSEILKSWNHYSWNNQKIHESIKSSLESKIREILAAGRFLSFTYRYIYFNILDLALLNKVSNLLNKK